MHNWPTAMHCLLRPILFAILVGPTWSQNILHVDANRPSTGDGLSWTTAFVDLQDALDLARVNPAVQEIRVAQGTYRPDRGTLDRLRSFELVSGVRLIGGFANGGAVRHPRNFPSILSGDLAGNDGPPGAGGSVVGRTENSEHVVIGTNLGPGSVIDGFRIQAGYSSSIFPMFGGGMYVQGGQLAIEDCEFLLSRAERGGGGLALDRCAAQVNACVFHQNSGASSGGGALVVGPIATHWSQCRFEFNFGGSGAGLAAIPSSIIGMDGSPVHMERCDFVGNRGDFGGTQGGGLFLGQGSGSVVEDCNFVDNVTNGGGGLYVQEGDVEVSRCHFQGNQTNGDGGGAFYFENFGHRVILPSRVTHCTAWGNSGVLAAVGVEVEFVHCTWADNRLSTTIPGMTWPAAFNQESTVILRHSIVWGHQPIGNQGDERDHFAESFGSAYLFENCLIEDWAGMLPGTASSADPQFLDPTGPDGNRLTTGDNRYDLGGTSPALDAAPAGSLAPSIIADAWLRARYRDADGDGQAQADLGALERPRTDDFGTPFCQGQPANGSGLAAFLMGVGSPQVALGTFELVAENLPPAEFAFVLNSQGQGVIVAPGGSLGNLCLGGGMAIGRHNRLGEILLSDAAGRVHLGVDLADLPSPLGSVAAMPGETWNFQLWHRQPGGQSNFSNGLSIEFQ